MEEVVGSNPIVPTKQFRNQTHVENRYDHLDYLRLVVREFDKKVRLVRTFFLFFLNAVLSGITRQFDLGDDYARDYASRWFSASI